MNNTFIERVSTFSDLGLMVDSRLSWNEHVVNITTRANQSMGLVKRTLGCNINKKVKLLCYKTLVQPILEYSSPVWGNINRKGVEKIESVQRRATKFIINNYSYELHYETRLINCELLPLSYRRMYLDLSLYMSMLLEDNCLDFLTYFQFQEARRNRDAHTLITDRNHSKHKYYEDYFFNRITYIWNAM